MGFEPVDVGDPDLNRTLNHARAEADPSPPAWWWLSFVDTAAAQAIPLDEQVPGGPSHLGACWVHASNGIMAVQRARELGINPGGEVAIYGPLDDDELPPEVPREKLLSAAEWEKLDAEIVANKENPR